jgi:hypothetical protein
MEAPRSTTVGLALASSSCPFGVAVCGKLERFFANMQLEGAVVLQKSGVQNSGVHYPGFRNNIAPTPYLSVSFSKL